MHELNASKGHGGRPEGLEPHHRSHLTLDRSMVLFDNIVEVLDLADLNLCVVRRVVALDRAVLAPLLSMVIFAGVPCWPVALYKKRKAALRSRFAVMRGSVQRMGDYAALAD